MPVHVSKCVYPFLGKQFSPFQTRIKKKYSGPERLEKIVWLWELRILAKPEARDILAVLEKKNNFSLRLRIKQSDPVKKDPPIPHDIKLSTHKICCSVFYFKWTIIENESVN